MEEHSKTLRYYLPFNIEGVTFEGSFYEGTQKERYIAWRIAERSPPRIGSDYIEFPPRILICRRGNLKKNIDTISVKDHLNDKMISENISGEFRGILEQILGLGANFGQDTLEIRKVQQLIETN